MRARHRHFLAALCTAISVVLAPAPACPAHPIAVAHFDVHNCPSGTAWDNLLKRCV